MYKMDLVCWLLVVLSMCCLPALGRSITYKNCGPANVISEVDLSPCPSEPCTFHKGINVTVGIKFKSTAPVTSITARVYGIVAGIPVPYSLPKSDGCNGCNLTCPLEAGDHAYQNLFPVLSTYPNIKLPVKWTLVDSQNIAVVCFEFPMAIVD